MRKLPAQFRKTFGIAPSPDLNIDPPELLQSFNLNLIGICSCQLAENRYSLIHCPLSIKHSALLQAQLWNQWFALVYCFLFNWGQNIGKLSEKAPRSECTCDGCQFFLCLLHSPCLDKMIAAFQAAHYLSMPIFAYKLLIEYSGSSM